MVVQLSTNNAICGVSQASHPIVLFHVARDPEFTQGIQDGRQMLSPAQKQDGWVTVPELLQFVQSELAPANTLQELPIYNLGLVAGLFSSLVEAATVPVEHTDPLHTFTIQCPEFIGGMEIGAETFAQDYAEKSSLTDRELFDFFQIYLTPFQPYILTNTGVLFGFMRSFHKSNIPLTFVSMDCAFMSGYMSASQDWHIWNKDELLTDQGFAEMLAVEVAEKTRLVMQESEPWYTETYQIGYACGLVSGLLSDQSIAMSEVHTVSLAQ